MNIKVTAILCLLILFLAPQFLVASNQREQDCETVIIDEFQRPFDYSTQEHTFRKPIIVAMIFSVLGHGIIFSSIELLQKEIPPIEFTGDSGEDDATYQMKTTAPTPKPQEPVKQETTETEPVKQELEKPETAVVATSSEKPKEIVEPIVEEPKLQEPEVEAISTAPVPEALDAQPVPDPVDLTEVPVDTNDAVEKALLNLKVDVDKFIGYPPVAVENEIEGEVIAAFRIDRSGQIVGIRIATSSGYRLLDDEVTRALINVSKNWRYTRPSEIPEQLEVMYPVQFQLVR